MGATTIPPLAEPSTREPAELDGAVAVRSYDRYADAKRAVDRLMVGEIPDRRITVIGRGLRWRARAGAGRLIKWSTWMAALVCAAASLIFWGIGAFDGDVAWIGAVIAGGVIGALLGLLVGIGAWLAARFVARVPETGHVAVDHFDVFVEQRQADRARDLLGDDGAAVG